MSTASINSTVENNFLSYIFQRDLNGSDFYNTVGIILEQKQDNTLEYYYNYACMQKG